MIARSSMVMAEQLFKFFVVFFVVVEPISLIPLFAGLTEGATPAYQRNMAGKSAAIALGICVLFALAGARFLQAMGIELSSFRIAGGSLLFLILARHGVRADPPARARPRREREEALKREDISVFPLAFPFIGRPGCAGHDTADGRRDLAETGVVRRIPGCRRGGCC